MSVDTSDSVKEVVALLPGRALRFSPAWECSDATVIFDANSGDYWLVAELAYDILRIVQSCDDGILILALEEQLAATHAGEDMHSSFLQTLHSLVDNQLLRQAAWYTSRLLPMDDADD